MSPDERKEYDEELRQLLLSELLIAIMEADNISVRKLAKMVGLSPTVVQAMRTGKKEFTMRSFFKVLSGLNCNFFIEHKGNMMPLASSHFRKK